MSMEAQRTHLLSGTEQRGFLREALAVISSSNLATACGVLQNLVVLRLVPPAFTGVWTAIRTVVDYGNYSSLGIPRAAGFDIAVASGQGDRVRMRRLADVTMTIELWTAGIFALGLLGVGSLKLTGNDIPGAAAFCAAAIISLVSRYYTFNLTVLRSKRQITSLARTRAFGAFSELALFTSGAYFFGFYGMLLAAILAQILNACFVRYDGGLRFGAIYDLGLTLRLIWTGWPFAAEAIALKALQSVDRFVILSCLVNGEEQLGWYKIAIVMGAWTLDQSNQVSNVLFPRLGETLGRTSDPAAVLRLGLRTAEVIALSMVICSAGLLLVGVPIAHWLLPNYRPGLVAAGGMVAGAAFLGISMPLRYALLTVKRIRWMILVTGLAAAVSLGGGIALLHGSEDLVGQDLGKLAWNSAAAAGLLLVMMLLLCCVGCRKLWNQAAVVALASVYSVAGTIILLALSGNTKLCWLAAGTWCIYPAWILSQRIDWQDLLHRGKRTEIAPPDGPDAT